MSLPGYKPKTKPALWQSAFPSQIQKSKPALNDSPGRSFKCLPGKVANLTPEKIAKLLRRPTKRRKPVRKVSPAQAKLNRQYSALKLSWFLLPENRYCVLYPLEPATDLHHSRGRGGPGKMLLTLTRLWVPLSRAAHNWVEQNRTLARKLGLLCPQGKWDTLPSEQEIQEHQTRINWLRYYARSNFYDLKPRPLISSARNMELHREVKDAFQFARNNGLFDR